MSIAAGEFAVAASCDSNVLPRNQKAQAGEPRHMLTREKKSLCFDLSFSNGQEMTVTLEGSGYEPPSLWHVMDAIRRFAALAPSWDSYGARPLNPSAVRRILGLLPALLSDNAPEPTIIPTREGGLQVEWHRNGIDLEVRVPPSGPIAHFFADAKSGDEHEWEGPLNPQIVSQAFAQMR